MMFNIFNVIRMKNNQTLVSDQEIPTLGATKNTVNSVYLMHYQINPELGFLSLHRRQMLDSICLTSASCRQDKNYKQLQAMNVLFLGAQLISCYLL